MSLYYSTDELKYLNTDDRLLITAFSKEEPMTFGVSKVADLDNLRCPTVFVWTNTIKSGTVIAKIIDFKYLISAVIF